MTGPQPRSLYIKALLDGLHELGYVYGSNFVTEPRGAEGKPDRYPGLVDELLKLHVDVIAAVPAAAPALKQATSTLPIVLTGVSAPVALGLAQSLGHPGGNFTGLSDQQADLIGKRLELLKELIPSAAPVAIVWDRRGPGGVGECCPVAETIARQRRWRVLLLEIRNADELERVFRTATVAGCHAVLMQSTLQFAESPQHIAELAIKSRLATMYAFRFYVDGGGLMSYAPSLIGIWRRCAVYVDKILKGARPGDLPIEQPTQFEFVINLKTAKALG